MQMNKFYEAQERYSANKPKPKKRTQQEKEVAMIEIQKLKLLLGSK